MATAPGRRTDRRTRRRLALVAALLVGALALGGCGLGGNGIYDLPLPGGASISDGYPVTAHFDDALDLVPQAAVKVDDVTVGKVSKVTLSDDGRTAVVQLEVDGSVQLPANTTARITQTSLLGEKYVALERPSTGATGSLRASGTISLQGTSEAVDAERVLGALSLLLNGGGIAQYQQISKELAAVSSGRDGDIRTFLTEVSSFVEQLNTRKASITAALDSLDRLSATLADNQDKIAAALDGLPPGLQVLVDQRTQLVAMLRSLDSLSQVTVRTIDASQADMVADLKRLDPILTQLAAAGQTLPDALQVLFTFPFPDSVLGAVKGDYVNAFLVTSFSTPGATIPSTTLSTGWPNAYPDAETRRQARLATRGRGNGSASAQADGGTTTPGTSAPTTSSSTPTSIGPPPMIFTPTSSAAPGMPSSTITTTGPSGTSTGSPTPSTGTTAPTGGTPTSGTTSPPSTSTGTSPGTPTGTPTDTSTGTPTSPATSPSSTATSRPTGTRTRRPTPSATTTGRRNG